MVLAQDRDRWQALVGVRKTPITIEPVYNVVGLYDTSPIALDILWYKLNFYC
jgi:hypothetical protein